MVTIQQVAKISQILAETTYVFENIIPESYKIPDSLEHIDGYLHVRYENNTKTAKYKSFNNFLKNITFFGLYKHDEKTF